MPYYQMIWKAAIPLKVKVFLWLSVKNTIQTRANLTKKGLSINQGCVLYGASEETTSHLFVKCSFTRSLLYAFKLQHNIKGWLGNFNDYWSS